MSPLATLRLGLGLLALNVSPAEAVRLMRLHRETAAGPVVAPHSSAVALVVECGVGNGSGDGAADTAGDEQEDESASVPLVRRRGGKPAQRQPENRVNDAAVEGKSQRVT